jgi:ribosomal protein S18 acetylase RimI-like enzyme
MACFPDSFTLGRPSAERGIVALKLRPVGEEDRARVEEISAQIWDGEDYVPSRFDEWLADQEGEIVGAEIDGNLIAFARRTWLRFGHAWFEGIRTDPAYRGLGAGRAITEYLIESAKRAAAEKIHLSTYIDNEASIHIIESYGFRRVASFAYLEKDLETRQEAGDADGEIVDVSQEETARFVGSSRFLALANRRFPRGWRFVPFDLDPLEAVARLGTRIGIRRRGDLVALLCLRQPVGGNNPTVLNFGDGSPDDVRRLLRRAHTLYAGRKVAVMVPKVGEDEAALLPVLRDFGYETWDDYASAVFVYELGLI